MSDPQQMALRAATAEPLPETPLLTLESEGVVLIYGRDEQAVMAAELLKEDLDVTVLIKPQAALPPSVSSELPIVTGAIRTATGHLGDFRVTVGPQGAVSRCDVIVDLSGDAPLFPAADLRDGYVRADPGNPAAVMEAVMSARELVGTFEKPRYISFTEHLCAHSRSRIVGCKRCLDLCPTGAITPAGDHVVVDASICAGCGQCAAACPTGAAAYTLPPSDALMRKLRALMLAYRQAGGEHAVVLVHDESHGAPLIDALSQFGDGLPTNVLPFAVNEVTQIGLEAIAAAFAYGASSMRLLLRARPRHDVLGLTRTTALAEPILAGLGFGAGRIETIETDDPDELGATLRAVPAMPAVPRPSSFLPMGDKRSVMRFALSELHSVSPAPADVVPLPAHAPFGAVEIDTDGCTLCLSCVSACPTGALTADPERPLLRFAEQACIQCGLCKATCPEKVITLKPRLDFHAGSGGARVLKEEAPFHCIRCQKAFGVKSTVERVIATLADKHWMFKDSPERLDLIRMCDECRVVVVSEQDLSPYG